MEKIKYINNAQVVLENGIIWDGVIGISNDRIINYGSAIDIKIPDNAEVIDAQGAYVGPGFVDIHVHGGNGFAACFETEKAADFFLKHGTTSFLATPSGNQDKFEAIKNVKKLINKIPQLKGMYVEAASGSEQTGRTTCWSNALVLGRERAAS